MCSDFKKNSPTAENKLLITRFPLEAGWGGEEEIHLLLAKILVEKGRGVELLSSDKELAYVFRQNGFRVFAEFQKDITSRKALLFSILTVPFFFLRGLFWIPFFRRRGVRSVLFLTFMEKICWTPLARIFGMEVFWGQHAPLGNWFFQNPYLAFWKLWAKGKLKIIVPARAQKEELLPLLAEPEKVIILPNTLSSNKICAQNYNHDEALQNLKKLLKEKCGENLADKNYFFIGTANRLSREKGMDDALEAMRMLHSPDEPYILLCAGAGPERKGLEDKIQVEGLAATVFFLGFLTPEELLIFYQGIDLFLLPSHQEPFGIALLEAMSARKAIIASAVGGIPEVLGAENPGLFPPHDPAQIAARIHFFRTEEQVRENMGELNFQRYLEKFAPSIFADRVLSIFCARN